MMAIGEAELLCDFAETYRIYAPEELPVKYMATLACGLRDDSRIYKKMADIKGEVDFERKILVSIFDKLNWLVWSRTEDGQNNTNRPESLYNKIFNKEENPGNEETLTFESAEDFQKEWENRRSHGIDNR